MIPTYEIYDYTCGMLTPVGLHMDAKAKSENGPFTSTLCSASASA